MHDTTILQSSNRLFQSTIIHPRAKEFTSIYIYCRAADAVTHAIANDRGGIDRVAANQVDCSGAFSRPARTRAFSRPALFAGPIYTKHGYIA